MDVKPLSIFRSNNFFLPTHPMHFLGRYSPQRVRFQLINILQPFHIMFLDFGKKIQNKTPLCFSKKQEKRQTICDKDEKLHVVWGSRKRQLYISTLSKAFESDCRVTAISLSAWCSQTVGNSYMVRSTTPDSH